MIMQPTDLEASLPEDPTDIKTLWQQLALALFIAVPFIALIVAVPVLWGWGLNWQRRGHRGRHVHLHRPWDHGWDFIATSRTGRSAPDAGWK